MMHGQKNIKLLQRVFVEKIKTYILLAIKFFFRKSCPLWDNLGKYCRARHMEM